MAYTPGYEYDIFISYAHDDDVVLAGEKGWVSQFHDYLNDWLVKWRDLEGLKIWFDTRGLQGNTDFDAEIQQCIEQSALFLVIHSRRYLKSAYCAKELDWFLDHNQRHYGSIKTGNQSRLFNTLINNIHHREWPEKLAGTSGFMLHDAETDNDYGYPIELYDRRFAKQIRKLADAAANTLNLLKESAPVAPHSSPEPEQNKTGLSIFLADVADTQKAFRNRLITEIGDKAEILPFLPPPYPAAEHQQKLTQTLEQSSLSIHLLDGLGGRDVDGMPEMTYPRLQAGAVRHRQQPALIWVPETLAMDDIEDEVHQSWLDELENGVRADSGFRFVRSSKQAFIDQVKQLLDQLQADSAQTNNKQGYLLDTHQKDLLHAFQLGTVLMQKGLQVEFSQDSDNPVDGIENFEHKIRSARNLIIVFGHVTPKWVTSRIQAAIKVAMVELESSLENIWVFMLPHCQGKDSLQFPPICKVNCLENPSTSEIDPRIVEQLLQQSAGGQG